MLVVPLCCQSNLESYKPCHSNHLRTVLHCVSSCLCAACVKKIKNLIFLRSSIMHMTKHNCFYLARSAAKRSQCELKAAVLMGQFYEISNNFTLYLYLYVFYIYIITPATKNHNEWVSHALLDLLHLTVETFRRYLPMRNDFTGEYYSQTVQTFKCLYIFYIFQCFL